MVICLRWVVVLAVLGVVVTICVGVCMVHLQSALYYRCFIYVYFRGTQCVLCVWLLRFVASNNNNNNIHLKSNIQCI